MNFQQVRNFNRLSRLQTGIFAALLLGAVVFVLHNQKPARVQTDEKRAALENALYTRTEFFGAEALVPFPTAEARERLAEVSVKFPDDAEILWKIAELDEKLGRFEKAETVLHSLKNRNPQPLADFYGRRAAFAKQAAVLEEILQNAPPEKRGAAFSNLIDLAKKHGLQNYLASEFYQQVIARDEGALPVLFEFIDKLVADKNYAEALKLIGENKAKFPASKKHFLEKEISIFTSQGKTADAEKVFSEAFDPFWTTEESERFYSFLRENDRFRAYEAELRRRFRENSSDYQTALRLIHFAQYEGDEIGAIVRTLENARAARGIRWQRDELLTVTQLLIEAGDGNAASRFLYTLCTNFDVKTDAQLRRRALYQLFELLTDSGYERLALTRGSLDFYESVARSDARPGITTGILSLIFADTDPRGKFTEKQEIAVKFFNRAAAYRVFQEFKKEYADAPELAQMYLDIVRLYTSSNELEIAARTLSEFESKYNDFKDFPDASLKLADALIVAGKFDKEREIYPRLLDFLGKSEKPKFPFPFFVDGVSNDDPTGKKPQILTYPPASNQGIVGNAKKPDSYYYYDAPNTYRNHLSTRANEIFYADVLARFVASLARENKTAEILDLYAAETAKYPTEARLYEQMLQWLGQTNLAARQFDVYQKALQNFPERTWQDRFARWLIRQRRTEDFENYAQTIVSGFDDLETQDFLRQFIDGKEFADAKSADAELFFALYKLAHRRFPHNIAFVKGLLRYYRQNRMDAQWRALLAEYYFESAEIRHEFLTHLAKNNELPPLLRKAGEMSSRNGVASLPYKLFRADASVWLSDFEKAVVFYRELNELYPQTAEFSENFLSIARSFGQTNRHLLIESADFSQKQADESPAHENFRVRAGELQAELGDYEKARANWRRLVAQRAGENESYLDTATVFWDYFQFDDALQTIAELRQKTSDPNLYAFQAGAIFEAKKERRAAIGEYLRAFDNGDATAERWRAKQRLKQLFGKPGAAKEINAAFETERKKAKNAFQMTFHFADALYQLDRQPEAVAILRRHIESEKSAENLQEAKRFFRDLNEPAAVRDTLVRQIEIARTPRDAIAFRLQLAENHRQNFAPRRADAVLAQLLQKYPSNYGVLKEVETFYWDLGMPEKSIAVLREARSRARGEYAYRFDRKLAKRLTALNRAAQAEAVLARLMTENPHDDEVFAELSDIYVRANQPQALRKTLAAAIKALGERELEAREYNWLVSDLRRKMISAFTRMKDYDSAAEQYIEIINREPENEALLEEAVDFARRFGGAARLLAYYEKTAREAFKNYRWNVVLARLYDAQGDLPKAAESYRTAIYNQPEMLELYEALGGIYLKMPNLEAALQNADRMLELSGEDQKYLKQKVQILEKLGRKADADALRTKLPAEVLPKPSTLTEQFAEAQNLRRAETDKSAEAYAAAFENLLANPSESYFKAADVTGFVETLHGREPLDRLTAKLWKLREHLTVEINNPESLKSGKARDNLKTLDGAMIESLSALIKTKATGGEILAFGNEIQTRLAEVEKQDSQTVSLLENLMLKCGFDDLREKLLVKNLENAAGDANASLRTLLGFYEKRGNYGRILEILENDLANRPLEFVKIYAENARIAGESDKELAALRLVFARQTADDGQTRRYLEILHEKNRPELENLLETATTHRLQIVNFLLAAGETELARRAIEKSSFPQVWKRARAAETSLKFGNFAPENETDFTSALHTASIGELIDPSRDETNQLLGGDWFNLANKYGQWLAAAGQNEKAENYLAARTENRPPDAAEQFNLAFFYLERRNFDRALEHFSLAAELRPDDKTLLRYVGAAHFQLGDKKKALETWSRIIAGDDASLENASSYLAALADFGMANEARENLKPLLSKKLEAFEDDSTNTETKEALKEFVRNLARTFDDEARRSAFFIEICRAARRDKLLPEILIEESLIAKKDFGEMHRLLIERSEAPDDFDRDYEYAAVWQTNPNPGDAELAYDAANNFEIEATENKRLERREKYLDFLLENREYSEAAELIREIENELNGRFPRPLWLRTAEIRVLISQGKQALAAAKMLKLTGVQLAPNASAAVLPNLERLNLAAEILRRENRNELRADLEEAFYARYIALGQYDSANFAGLARAAFEKGNEAEGLRILRLMCEFNRENWQAELDSTSPVARFANTENLSAETRNDLNIQETLQTAAEIATRFGFPVEAAAYREKLREITPADSANTVELARLYQTNGKTAESVQILLGALGENPLERKTRWRILIVLGEAVGDDADFWAKIMAENQALEQRDVEIWSALRAFSLFQTGQTERAIDLLREIDFTFELKFLRAVFEKKAGLDEQALASFSQISQAGDDLTEVFAFYASAPVTEQINLSLKTGKIAAALDLMKKHGVLPAIEKTNFGIGRESKLKTLDERAHELKFTAARRLLENLAPAAEQTGDLALAIEIAELQSKFLTSADESKNAAARIENLRARLAAQNAARENTLVVNEKPVSDL